MKRRVGKHAVRDAGSTTGAATAVLALLSAGTLATLGVVTAGQLRDGGLDLGLGVHLGDVSPPTAVPLTPTATPPGADGGGASTGGPTSGSGVVQALPEAVPGGTEDTSRPVLSSSGGAPAGPTETPATAAPTQPAQPAGPEATGGLATSSTDVLGEKKGKHLGQLKKLARENVARPTLTATHTPQGRAVGYRHGHGTPAVTPVGPAVPQAATPSPVAVERAAEERATSAKGRGQGHGHGPADLPVPLTPLLLPTPDPSVALPLPAAAPPGKALGRTAP